LYFYGINLPIGGVIAVTIAPPSDSAFHNGATIMKKSPWHSIKQDVHHNNTDCNTGNNIETENRREGTGGKPLCKECAKLS
jgi:hypothetical protein